MNKLVFWAKLITWTHWTLTAIGAAMILVLAFNPAVPRWVSVIAAGLLWIGSWYLYEERSAKQNGEALARAPFLQFVNVVWMDLLFIEMALLVDILAFEPSSALSMFYVLVWTFAIGAVIVASLVALTRAKA